MNRIILRFIIVKDNKTFEVIFDSRLTFIQNFKMLKDVLDVDIERLVIMDNKKQIALRKDVPINEFNFKNFMTLYIF